MVRYTPVPTAGPTLDPHSFTVQFIVSTESDLALTARVAQWWKYATIGRSEIRVVERDADVTIRVLPGPGVSSTSRGNPNIFIYSTDTGGRPATVLVFMHEIGHFLGCCFGNGTEKGHYISGTPGIMSNPVCASCLLFSDRELDQMGLSYSSKSGS